MGTIDSVATESVTAIRLELIIAQTKRPSHKSKFIYSIVRSGLNRKLTIALLGCRMGDSVVS